ncbi:helix-turn-helix domain-containing protein [Rugamonas sp. A1-17]|nr:helix-turn-helix domain-containing protein [Rugamonas sp. A1-17]
MKVVILGFDGCMSSAMVGLLDMFELARHAVSRSDASDKSGQSLPRQKWEVVSATVDGNPLRDGQGREVAVNMAAADISRCDAVLIPGLVPGLDGLPQRSPEMRQIGAWLRAQHAHGALIGGSCAGVFVLGEAGLLDGRRCTTTWWFQDELKQRYPKAVFMWGSPLLEDRRVVSVGGPLSWVDLALHCIRQLAGPEVARITADFAVADNAPLNHVVYAPNGYVRTRDPFLFEAENMVRQTPDLLTASALAALLATSERTLHRRLKALVGESPKAFITRVRLETARVLLEKKASNVKRIAQQSGYADESSFRRAFTRFMGMSPNAYRQWIQQREGSGA